MEYESDDMPMVYFYEVDLDDGRFSLRAMEVFANRAFTSIFKAMYKKAPGRYREAETFYPLKLKYVLNENLPDPVPQTGWRQRIVPASQEDIPAHCLPTLSKISDNLRYKSRVSIFHNRHFFTLDMLNLF